MNDEYALTLYAYLKIVMNEQDNTSDPLKDIFIGIGNTIADLYDSRHLHKVIEVIEDDDKSIDENSVDFSKRLAIIAVSRSIQTFKID